MGEETDYTRLIDELIRRKCAFAMYRHPGEAAPHFVMQSSGTVRTLTQVEALNEQKGFVIAPFRASVECPVVLIEPDVFSLDDVRLPVSPQPEQPLCGEALPGEEGDAQLLHYTQCFEEFIDALHKGEFDKLVLSRKQILARKAEFSPAVAFYKACAKYIYSYVYMCYTPYTGLWLGSTPEIILSGEQGAWHTMALAATQSVQNGELPREWSEKNRKEQAYVSAYIREQLLSLGVTPQEEGPYAVFAGALSHLRTDFRFSLSGSNPLGSLLNLLHPTPAVCGLPKEEAYRFILDKEGYNRRYYSGFIGWMDPQGRTDLYVNLRCMEIGTNALTLYAGGGLLASSTLDDEWQETEKKMQTMKIISD